jgi:hypothetical protein
VIAKKLRTRETVIYASRQLQAAGHYFFQGRALLLSAVVMEQVCARARCRCCMGAAITAILAIEVQYHGGDGGDSQSVYVH